MFAPPPKLIAGDTVRIVAPAKQIKPEELTAAIGILQSWGLKVELGKHVFASYNQFAGTDAQRLSDLQEALDAPHVRAVICARGGYGLTRIIDQVNGELFAKHPKWVVGFSDVTVLLNKLQIWGYACLHAIMPKLFGDEGNMESLKTLKDALFGTIPDYTIQPHTNNRTGTVIAPITGGNLTLLCNSLGTSTDVDWQGKILFIEDVGEHLYHLDRMLVQLKRAGKLAGLAGLVVGHFTDMQDGTPAFGGSALDIIAEHVAGYLYPVCMGFPAGHEPDNRALVCGKLYYFNVSHDNVFLSPATTTKTDLYID